jgi:tetratricopeptide (TPR) repeat protein
LPDPRTLDLVVLESVKNDGAEAGISRYRYLREQYYGSGSYDFGPMVLVDVATTLAESHGNTEAALEMLNLNTEMNPDHSTSYYMKSQIQVLTGDKDGAVANTRKALELDPENEAARKLLDQLDPEGTGQ